MCCVSMSLTRVKCIALCDLAFSRFDANDHWNIEENSFVRLKWYFSQNQKPSLYIFMWSEDGNILSSCGDRYLQQKVHIKWIDFVEVWKYFESSIKNTTGREEKQKELLHHWTTTSNVFEVFNRAGWLFHPLYCQLVHL